MHGMFAVWGAGQRTSDLLDDLEGLEYRTSSRLIYFLSRQSGLVLQLALGKSYKLQRSHHGCPEPRAAIAEPRAHCYSA